MTVFKPTEIFQRLREGHTLVTGNSRLARVLAGQYSQWRIERGDRQWASPAIHAWSAWLDRLWERAALNGAVNSARAVPNQQQLTSLWERVLQDSGHAGNLLRPQALAVQMRDTRRAVVEWNLDLNHPAWHGEPGDNHEAFRIWNAAFESLCREEGWLPPDKWRQTQDFEVIASAQLPPPDRQTAHQCRGSEEIHRFSGGEREPHCEHEHAATNRDDP